MTFTYAPLDVWPQPQTTRRQSSPFSAQWRSTREALERELRALHAGRAVLQIDVTDAHIRLDGNMRADFRSPRTPRVALSFASSNHGDLTYRCDIFTEWHANVRAIALGLEALRKVERYGIASRGEQYAGWRQLPAGIAMGAPMTRTEAGRVLADLAGDGWYGDDFEGQAVLLAENAPNLVTDAYRWAVKLHHPDNGGDADLFARATEARDVLIGAAE
jgi:hypothetical protein